jgi:Invasion associated locus B (IalB) protein
MLRYERPAHGCSDTVLTMRWFRGDEVMIAVSKIPVLAMALGAVLVASPVVAQQRPAAQTSAAQAPASGAQTFLLGTFDDWKALMSGQAKQKVCYALAQPKDRKPATLKRDPAFLFISNRMADGTKNEIAFRLGFAAKAGQDGTLTIGSQNFALLANAESAFLKNPAQEAAAIEAMKRAGEFTVKVASLRGNETTDRYSLKGFSKALERMQKECP